MIQSTTFLDLLVRQIRSDGAALQHALDSESLCPRRTDAWMSRMRGLRESIRECIDKAQAGDATLYVLAADAEAHTRWLVSTAYDGQIDPKAPALTCAIATAEIAHASTLAYLEVIDASSLDEARARSRARVDAWKTYKAMHRIRQ